MVDAFETVRAKIGGTDNAAFHDPSGSEKSRLAHASNGASVARSTQQPISSAVTLTSDTAAIQRTDSPLVKPKYKHAATHDGMTRADNIEVTHTTIRAAA